MSRKFTIYKSSCRVARGWDWESVQYADTTEITDESRVYDEHSVGQLQQIKVERCLISSWEWRGRGSIINGWRWGGWLWFYRCVKIGSDEVEPARFCKSSDSNRTNWERYIRTIWRKQLSIITLARTLTNFGKSNEKYILTVEGVRLNGRSHKSSAWWQPRPPTQVAYRALKKHRTRWSLKPSRQRFWS